MPEINKVSIIEKIAQNRFSIIKKTGLIALGIFGAVTVSAFLAKERFPDEENNTTDAIEED